MNDSRSNYDQPPDEIDRLPPVNSGGDGGVWLVVVAAFVLLIVVLGSISNSASDMGTPAKAASSSSPFDAKGFADSLNKSRPKPSAPIAASAAPSWAPSQATGTNEVSAEVLRQQYVTMRYRANGLEAPSESDLKSIAITICEDIGSGETGRRYFLSQDIPGPGSDAAAVAEALNYAYATTTACNLTGAFDLGNTVRARLLDYIRENSEPLPFIPSTGGSVRCNDGSYSSAGGKQGGVFLAQRSKQLAQCIAEQLDRRPGTCPLDYRKVDFHFWHERDPKSCVPLRAAVPRKPIR